MRKTTDYPIAFMSIVAALVALALTSLFATNVQASVEEPVAPVDSSIKAADLSTLAFHLYLPNVSGKPGISTNGVTAAAQGVSACFDTLGPHATV